MLALFETFTLGWCSFILRQAGESDHTFVGTSSPPKWNVFSGCARERLFVNKPNKYYQITNSQ